MESNPHNPGADYGMKQPLTGIGDPIKAHRLPIPTQGSYETSRAGPPNKDRSWQRVLTNCVPLEKGMANHFSMLASRTPQTV